MWNLRPYSYNHPHVRGAQGSPWVVRRKAKEHKLQAFDISKQGKAFALWGVAIGCDTSTATTGKSIKRCCINLVPSAGNTGG